MEYDPNRAPKSEPEPSKRRQRARKTPTTITLPHDMIEDLTEIAEERGVSRAAVMTLAMADAISAWKKQRT